MYSVSYSELVQALDSIAMHKPLLVVIYSLNHCSHYCTENSKPLLIGDNDLILVMIMYLHLVQLKETRTNTHEPLPLSCIFCVDC